MIRGRDKRKKMNNQGSALVVVVVVIAFIAILVTVLLYVSVMNYQMKATDFKTRVSFYGSEVPLEELRLQMALDWADAGKVAYEQVMMQYAYLTNDDLRMAEYQTVMFEELDNIWSTRNYNTTNPATPVANDWVYGITNILGNNSDYHVISGGKNTVKCDTENCPIPYHIIVVDMKDFKADPSDPLEPTPPRMAVKDDPTTPGVQYAVINGIKVTYTEDGFSSVIMTNFRLDVPCVKDASGNVDWGANAYFWYEETDALGVSTAVRKNYANAWTSESTNKRTEISYEDFVNYLNWTKQ